MIAKFLNGDYLTKIINKVLDLDLQKEYLLSSLNERVLTLYFKNEDLYLNIIPKKDKLIFTNEVLDKKNSNTILKGNYFDFFQLLISERKEKVLQNKIIEYEGSLHTLEYYQNFFKSFKFDYEFHLNRKIGVIPTMFILKPIKILNENFKFDNKKLQRELIDFIQEEVEILPSKLEFIDFVDDILEAKSSVERIESKINFLKKT